MSAKPGDGAAEVRGLLERVDELIKYAPNRNDPDVGYRAARMVLDEARWQLDDVADEETRDALVVEVGRRNDDLNMLLLDASRKRSAAPSGLREPDDLPQPEEQTLRPDARTGADRIPPNQRLVTSWPVLHVGRAPKIDLSSWRFACTGKVSRRIRWTWEEFRALPTTRLTTDFHCVTGWSRLDNTWEGVLFRDVAEAAGVRSEATHAVVYGANAYSANCDLETLMGTDVIFAWSHDGQPLSAEHGGPLRLVIPARYAWKSVKWVESVQFLDRDVAGYWEMRGYHNVADPFLEQRYA